MNENRNLLIVTQVQQEFSQEFLCSIHHTEDQIFRRQFLPDQNLESTWISTQSTIVVTFDSEFSIAKQDSRKQGHESHYFRTNHAVTTIDVHTIGNSVVESQSSVLKVLILSLPVQHTLACVMACCSVVML